jgi:hypothetical protein
MMKKWKLLLITTGALMLVLVVHIYVVTHKAPMHNAGIQLARIDLAAPVDSMQAADIRSVVLAMPGVKSCYMNIPQRTLVYAYELQRQDQNAVFAQVAAASPVQCKKYVVDAKAMTTGCPAIDHSSATYSLVNWIRSW